MAYLNHFRHSIDVILATFNGEKHIAEQIRSLQQCDDYETLVNRVVIVDDGSIDNTLSIVRSFAKYDPKIQVYPSQGKPLGPMKNFCRGISMCDAEFIMFCDQDDVWLKEKLVTTLKAMGGEACSIPRLVFSDLLVVDENLRVIENSYFSLKKIPKNWHDSLDALAKQNVASGCTMMANRALLNKALPIPDNAYMHDWWLALVAKVEGELIFIDQPLMLYRQHCNNVIGAGLNKRFDFSYRFKRFAKSVDATTKQAKALIDRFPYLANESKTLSSLASLSKQSRLHNAKAALYGNLRRSSLLGSVAMAFYCMTLNKQQ